MKSRKGLPEELKKAIKGLQDKHGAGVVLTSEDAPLNVEKIPTGSFTLDRILGGGLPKGRIIEIHGAESSGKTTISLFLAAQVQKAGGIVAFLDAENAYDREYASSIGVDTDALLVSQPTTLEENFDIIRAFAATNQVDLCIVDSVAALTPKSELEGDELLKDTMAVQARLLGKALRILTGPISRSKMIVIFINQLRDKVGVFYGEKTTTPGGKALKFYASVRLSVVKGERLTGTGSEQVGTTLKITAVKNKVAPPWRKGTIDLYFGSGIDLAADLANSAIEMEIFKKEGISYFLDGVKIAAGKDKTVEAIRQSEELQVKIREKLEEAFKGKD